MTDERLAEIQHRITKQRVTFNDVTELVQALRAERQKVAKTSQQMQWVNINERLPQEALYVLICYKALNFPINSVACIINGYWRVIDGDRLDLHRVSYWMPLPKLPTDIK